MTAVVGLQTTALLTIRKLLQSVHVDMLNRSKLVYKLSYMQRYVNVLTAIAKHRNKTASGSVYKPESSTILTVRVVVKSCELTMKCLCVPALLYTLVYV
jgi:hypothetical protein